MKKLLTLTALIGGMALLIANPIEAAQTKKVNFKSQGQNLVGNLHLPDNYKDGEKLPGVIVTGAWTTVKEQMPATYATALANRGYAALTFDFRGWGESKDSVKFLENPERKIQDINAAANFLVTRPEIDTDRVAGLGICASSGYMSDAAAANPNIKSLALVAPWLHDSDIVDAVYGGKEGVKNLINISRKASQTPNSMILEAASTTNEKSVMYQVPYYTETNRGLISEYDNKFNAASWEGWLTYDALKTADSQTIPTLLVHSESAAIPQGAIEYAKRAGKIAKLVMFKGVTQFDFYDQPKAVEKSVKKVAQHFNKTLR